MNHNINLIREFFDSGITHSYAFRYEQLTKLKLALVKYRSEIIKALQDDLAKPELEIYAGELGAITHELHYAQKNLRRWMKKSRVATPFNSFKASSYILPVPRGMVLIIGPWNYPLQLLLIPLIGAIAAGNCAVIKPSEYTPNISAIINRMLSEIFPANYVSVVEGDGALLVPQLINDFIFNYVFFTGSTRIGRIIAKLCAEKLIPYTLELGGKSPAIIDKNVDLTVAAKRLAWAKFFNAGQTCVAPDYVVVDAAIKTEFVAKLTQVITEMYSNTHDDLARIVNLQRFEILESYIKNSKVIYGGELLKERLQIMPTLLDEPALDSAVMCDEIFGPILPIISYQDLTELRQIISRNPNPLALYVFSKDKHFSNTIIEQIPFGGGGINTCLMHLNNPKLPFGGVMNSGNGNYHGKYTFETFSHQKAILDMATWFDAFAKYPPYTKLKLWIIKRLSV